MIRLLYQVHRWVGLALALFMTVWFFSGLIIIYGGSLMANRAQQLAHAETLAPEAGWLSLGDAWQRSAEARGDDTAIGSARLVRVAGEPLWLVEDVKGRNTALSAIDGRVQQISPQQAERVAQQWLSGAKPATVAYVDTLTETSSLRNYQDYKPFHRVAVQDGAGTELLISAVTGDVLQAATGFDRGLYLAGNWVHTFRWLDALGAGDSRRDVLIWSVGFALTATITGLVIGWLRWRPGFGGRPTYSQGRTHPYRTFWLRWHFWTGLIGGTLALLWTVSGYVNNNPWQVFSPAAASRQELARYQGRALPAAIKDWHPQALANDQVVELGWRRLGQQAVLLAYTRDGRRLPQAAEGAVARFDDATLQAAAQRLVNAAPIESLTLQQDYDSYYYPTHRQNALDKPLPVVRVELADAGHTHLYLDPQDGRLLLKQDVSRRVYRWLFPAMHYWDIGWLYSRPLWDVWTVSWIAFGLVLSVSSVVLGWRRLRRTVQAWRRTEEEETATVQLAES